MIDPIIELFDDGGWVLVALAGLSVMAWALLIREWTFLAERLAGGWTPIEQGIAQLESTGKVKADHFLVRSSNVVQQILLSPVVDQRLTPPSFQAQVMPYWHSEAILSQRSHRTVAVLAACMPLLGLLGTVMGMIGMFGALAEPGQLQTDAMAGGVSQALITTQAGLVMALPILLINGVLGSKIRNYLDTSRMMIKKIETAICVEESLSLSRGH